MSVGREAWLLMDEKFQMICFLIVGHILAQIQLHTSTLCVRLKYPSKRLFC